MTFVPQRRPSVRMGAIQYRDPIIGRSRRARGMSGMGATSTTTQITEGTTLLASGATAATLIGAGAAAGSVVPVLGTAIGALVGLGISLFSGSNKETGGNLNPTFVAITNKWYNWFLGRPADASGAAWWPGQMQADGIANAWMNFSTSKEPVAAGVAQKAAAYQSLGYGAPTDPPPPGTNPLVAPPLTTPYTTYVATSGQPLTTTQTPVQILTAAGASPAQIAALTPTQQAAAAAQVAPVQASILGGLSGTTLLLLLGGLGVGLLLMNKRPSSAGEST